MPPIASVVPRSPRLDSTLFSPRPGGYSLDKFLALARYMETATPWRVAGILLVTPLPGLVGALLPSLVPFQDLALGIRTNTGFLVAAPLICFIILLGTLLHWRAGAELPARVYSLRQLMAVALVATAVQHSFTMLVACTWRFPTPMSWIILSSFTGLSLAVGHVVVFRSRCRHDQELIDGIKRYAPALQFQSHQIVVYPAFSVLFDRATPLYQVLLTLVFPDFSTEVAVTGIEICASLYQSMILQNTPSTVAYAIIMGVDVLQGLAAVKLFMDRPACVARDRIVHDALVELRSRLTQAHSKPPTEVVAQALKLVSVAESILLVEYLEVAIPLVNAVFVVVSCQFSGAQYNTRLRHLYLHPEIQLAAFRSIVLYSSLQALSFVAMQLVMKYRYGLSAVYLLAFVLEHHWQSIVGKMVAWVPIILHFTVVYYGVDFSFRFDYAALLREAARG